MSRYSPHVVADRAGVVPDEIRRLTELGILTPNEGTYTDADVRRVLVVRELERAGFTIDDLARLVREGRLSLAFLDDAGFNVFAAHSDITFAELSAKTGIEVDRLLVLRDVTGGRRPTAQDRVREYELEIVQLVACQIELGFEWPAIERALHVYGDSLRRIAEAEAEWWRSQVQEPMLAGGTPAHELTRRAGEISPRLSVASDRALMAIYHAQQMHVWSTNIVDGVAAALEQAGLHARQERHPALCFLDVAGYTELTQERGDAAAAQLVERLNRIVQRLSVEHGGRPIKWLGDGVMVHFPDPPYGVVGALRMIEVLSEAGLPPAHVGLHAGPVIVQEGDFYGQTVNLAARIGEYARPGEVLVSDAIVAASANASVRFQGIGAVELKGVTGLVDLYVAVADEPSPP